MHTGSDVSKGDFRGYRKIKEADRFFAYDFRGKVVLDIGSSTGGFTKYALERGAKKVIAVEKGTRQMREPMRSDPRVELHEKTDIFDFIVSGVDVVVADVSFVSLTKVLKSAIMRGWGGKLRKMDFLVMLKPQFEAIPEQLNRGVVKNEKIRREIIKGFERWLIANKFLIVKKDYLTSFKRQYFGFRRFI